MTKKKCDVLRFTLKGSPPPLPKKRDFFWDRRPPPMSIRTFQRRMALAEKDDDLECILIDIQRITAGWSTLQTLHELISSARKQGKRVVAYLPEGGTIREYYLASAASEIWLPPSTVLGLVGLSIETIYLAPALERAGVRAQIEAVGRYKTAGEPLVHSKMTAESKEMYGEILEEMESLLESSLVETRNLGPVTARELIRSGPYVASKAQSEGLVDEICYPDQIVSKIFQKDSRKAKIRRWSAYAHGRHLQIAWPWNKSVLPVLELRGVLMEGKQRGTRGVVGAKEACKQIRKIRKDRSVPAAVIYVESRGGTVGASDQIRREIEKLSERKPVIVYMANVAASGGYMISAAAHHIVAQSGTLTGSIGVIAGKLSGRKLIEGLGLRHHSIRKGPNSGVFSATNGWSSSEKKAVRGMIEAHYEHFVEVVSRGRRVPLEDIYAVAEGRVWTGRQALENKLIDELGGLSEAIAAARKTSPQAQKALIKPIRLPAPKFPQMLLPQSLATALAWASIAESGTTFAIEPTELRIK